MWVMMAGPYRAGAASEAERTGDEVHDEVMMPLSLALADRCDAILRARARRPEQTARSSACGRAAPRDRQS